MTHDVGVGVTSDARVAAANLAGNADWFLWMHALAVHELVAKDAGRVGGPDTRRRLVCELAAEAGLPAVLVDANIRTVAWLQEHGLDHVAREPRLPIGLVGRVVANTDCDPATIMGLVQEAYVKGGFPSAIETHEQLREGRPSSDVPQPTDNWHFDSFHPACGRAGQIGRLPGQLYTNLIARFPPESRRVVIAMCGSGTGLDVCRMLGVSDYVGFDLRFDQRVTDLHGDRFLVQDATNPNWTRVCKRETAGLVVVAPPVFTFGHSADTALPTDLGAVRDPEDYIAALAVVLTAASSVLGVGGRPRGCRAKHL